MHLAASKTYTEIVQFKSNTQFDTLVMWYYESDFGDKEGNLRFLTWFELYQIQKEIYGLVDIKFISVSTQGPSTLLRTSLKFVYCLTVLVGHELVPFQSLFCRFSYILLSHYIYLSNLFRHWLSKIDSLRKFTCSSASMLKVSPPVSGLCRQEWTLVRTMNRAYEGFLAPASGSGSV